MDICAERDQAVATAIAEIRGIEEAQGVNPDALDATKEVLLELAERRDLFPLDDFPMGPDDGNSVIYRLSEDEDHRFALYASTALPGKSVHPHNHTTWAVIVGVVVADRAPDAVLAHLHAALQVEDPVAELDVGV